MDDGIQATTEDGYLEQRPEGDGKKQETIGDEGDHEERKAIVITKKYDEQGTRICMAVLSSSQDTVASAHSPRRSL